MIYLVDFENTGVNGFAGAHNLTSDDKVIVFYTDANKKINMDVLSSAKCSIEFKKTPIGKQSLDMCLVSYLGYLIGKQAGTEFAVVSNDSGYKSAINMSRLLNENVHIIQIRSFDSPQIGDQDHTVDVVRVNVSSVKKAGKDVSAEAEVILFQYPLQRNILDRILKLCENPNAENAKATIYALLTKNLKDKTGRKAYKRLQNLW